MTTLTDEQLDALLTGVQMGERYNYEDLLAALTELRELRSENARLRDALKNSGIVYAGPLMPDDPDIEPDYVDEFEDAMNDGDA